MKTSPPARVHVIATLFALVAALIARAVVQIRLVDTGHDPALASDLSYLVVPLVLVVLLFPVLVRDSDFIRKQLRPGDLTIDIALRSVAIAILLRVAWHAQVVAGLALGVNKSPPAGGPVDFFIAYACPPATPLLLSVLVACLLVPLVEELAHRAYVQGYFRRRGPVVAISVSTLVFVLLHRSPGWDFAFAGGVVLGTLYWMTGSLWSPVIAHATINLVPLLTLVCLDIHWQPHADSLPLWFPGLTAAVIAVTACVGVLFLLLSLRRRRDSQAPAPTALQGVGDAFDDV